MARCLALCMLSLATAVAADGLDRAITLFKDGEIVQAIGTLNTLTASEDAAVFHADIMLRVFENHDRSVEILEAWEGSDRVDVRLAALRGSPNVDESKLNCELCRYSDATVDPFYYQVARAHQGRSDEKFELAKLLLFDADHHLVEGRVLGRDHVRAFMLFRELADAGDPRGMFWAGGLLLRQDAAEYDGIPIDHETGWMYLNAAASFGYEPALDSLRNIPERLRHLGAKARTDLENKATPP